jgi:thiamine kinase-like enzyme
MVLSVEEAIARIPFLAGSRSLTTTQLGGGITNYNYRIDYDGKSCVLRITGANTELLGIRRDVEYAANLAAGKLGVAPEVLYYLEPEGYLVTRYIHGYNLPPHELVSSDNLCRFAEKIRCFHEQGPQLSGDFSVFRRIELFADVAQTHHSRFPDNFPWLIDKVHEIEAVLGKNPSTPKPCHNDLLNLNFLSEDGELLILDWEYAAMGDPHYDLANFCHHHQLNDTQFNILLTAYFDQVTPINSARVRLYWPMSQLYEAMWGVAQTGISTLDEDFQGYADMFINRTISSLNDPRFDRWLEVAAA